MKRDLYAFSGIAFVALLLVILCLCRPKPAALLEHAAAVIINVATSAPAVTPPLNQNLLATSDASTNSSEIAKNYKQGSVSKEQAMQQILSQKNNHSLDLYGQVVDQNGQPVIGADVLGSVLFNNGFVESGGASYHTVTDSQGRFSFLGLHGAILGIRPKKEGYFYDGKLPSSRPNNYQPDPDHPIVYTIWKLRGAEALNHSRFESRIPYDGTPIAFNLQTGEKVSGGDGDLRVTLLRYPLRIAPGLLHPYNWSVKIEFIGGGLIGESDPYPFLAPETGYVPACEQDVVSNQVPWSNEFIGTFYTKTGQGEYGRIFIDLSTQSKRSDTGITIESWVNPSGSRNLEIGSP